MTQISPHFQSREFVCPHCGQLPGGTVLPELLAGLERLRALAYSSGLVVQSGYRCPAHNATVGGASNSQHLYRSAADVAERATLDAVRGLRAFSGIGWQLVGGQQMVRHVDVRHATGVNTTAGTTAAPSLWEYAEDGSWH